MKESDRIAFDLARGDATKFRAVKKLPLEDVYKQLYILQEKAEQARQQRNGQ